MTFDTVHILDLDRCSDADLDALPFGVIGLGRDGALERYNATESRLAGLSSERVIGKHFFTNVAPCMNNFMVATRMEDEPELDATIEYVLTLRMRPTAVRLRMLKSAAAGCRYILIER